MEKLNPALKCFSHCTFLQWHPPTLKQFKQFKKIIIKRRFNWRHTLMMSCEKWKSNVYGGGRFAASSFNEMPFP